MVPPVDLLRYSRREDTLTVTVALFRRVAAPARGTIRPRAIAAANKIVIAFFMAFSL